ncbi:MAG TPA: hypothetical protein VM533_00170 [Fimbriiglobus sp.]|jgi:hypothetical protein|nr:hypothetical protein [Fimbriiglobus sp.]
MRRGWAIGVITLAGLVAGVAVRAQDPKATLAAGAPVPTGFRAYVVADDRFAPKVSPPKRQDDRDPRDRTKMMHDLVVEHGLNPTIAVFTRGKLEKDSPAARLAQALDPVVAKHRADNLGAYLVFLTLDKEFPQDDRRDEKGQFLRDLQADAIRALATELKTPRVPFALAAAKSPQATAWGLGENDLVVVLYDRMKVTRAWAFPAGQAPTDEQIKEIAAAADKLAGGG